MSTSNKPITYAAWIKKVKPQYKTKTIELVKEKAKLSDQEYKLLLKGSAIDPVKFDKLKQYTNQNFITY